MSKRANRKKRHLEGSMPYETTAPEKDHSLRIGSYTFPDWVRIDPDRRQIAWLIVRIAVMAVVMIMFASAPAVYTTVTATGVHYAKKRILLFVGGSLFCVLFPYAVRPSWPERFHRLVPTALYILLIPVVLFLAIYMGETVHGFDLLLINRKYILFNMILAFAIFLFFHILTNRIKWSIQLAYIAIVGFSIMNHYIDEFRGEAISAADIYVVGTALNVAGNYHFSFTLPVMRCMLVGEAVLMILTLLPKETPPLRKWFRLAYAGAAAGCVVFIAWLFGASYWPKEQGVVVKLFEPMKTYRKYGELLNFTRGFYYMIIETPEGYSPQSCRDLMDSLGYTSDNPADTDISKSPNVIVLMNESLADFSEYEQLGLSEDPTPYIHSLAGQENAIVGTLHVDVFGGRTANSEYEVLTGNSLVFMPANAVPYAMYVRKPEPSLSWNMQDMGYSGCEAFHPYNANGYSRPRAYPNLGFTRFVALENIIDELTPEDYLRKWVSDAADFRIVTELYEEAKAASPDAPYFLYNVTMQNHGSFVRDFDNFQQDISLSGELFVDMDEPRRYVNLAQYTDEAFRQLTDYFSQVEEPTILVMFGDHLPSIHDPFYQRLWGKALRKLEREEKIPRYVTPLVIWANYDINADGRYNEIFDDISVNYIGAEIMNIAGLPMTAYQKFLVDMQKEIPVLSTIGYVDGNGRYYDSDEKSYPFEEWLDWYSFLEYNYQFDRRHRMDEFFTLNSETSSMETYAASAK